MFQHEGPTRSPRKNAVLAGYLAAVAGFVNCAGFILFAVFTSHVTGAFGRLGIDLAAGERGALVAAGFVGAFFVGAFVASLLLEAQLGGRAIAYGLALTLEALLLAAFALSLRAGAALEGALLSAAMGLQNSLVTRLSGAVVRTTHLTGVVTDLGIEAARWSRWLGGRGERPSPQKTLLLVIIVVAFTAGAVAGAAATRAYGRSALAAPIAAVLAAATYALLDRPRR